MPNPALDKLAEEIAEDSSVKSSAAALLTSLAEKVRAVAGDQAATLDLANQLDASNKALSDAVVASIPAERETPTP